MNIFNKTFFVSIICIFFQLSTNSMDKDKDTYKIDTEKSETIRTLFDGKEEAVVGLINQSLEFKNLNKYKHGEFTIGSFNGATGFATLYPDDRKTFDCRLEDLRQFLQQKNNNIDNDTDDEILPGMTSDDGPSSETQNFIAKDTPKPEEKKCCCKLY